MSEPTEPKSKTKPKPKSHRLILPLGMRVLVKVIRDEDRTDAGLYLPEGAKEQHNEAHYAEVIEVARDKPTTEEPAENISGVTAVEDHLTFSLPT